MKIFETDTQFIKEEKGFIPPKDVKTYSILFKDRINESDRMEFPQYELFFRSYGAWGHRSFLEINYRGLIISAKSDENKETFIINLMSNLKKGNYVNKMNDFFKDRLSEKGYKVHKSVLDTNNPKIKQLENEVDTLKKIIKELKKKQKEDSIEQIQEENEILRNKLKKIKELLE